MFLSSKLPAESSAGNFNHNNMKTVKQNSYFWFSVAIVLTKFASMGDFAIYPITNTLYTLFPGKESLVNYIISGPQLIIMAMAFSVPLLVRHLGKKKLVVLSNCLFAVGSLFSAVVENVFIIAFGRTLVGVGQGILGVVSVTIVSDVITQPAQQAKYIGLYNASGNAAAMLLSLGAGALAGYSWQHPFLLYLISIPMILASVLFIPETGMTQAPEPASLRSNHMSFGREFWFLAIAAGIFSMLRTIIMYYMSSYAVENGLGGSGIAATAASMAQLFAFVGAMSFTLVYAKIRRWIMPLACGIMSAALILWYAAPSSLTVFSVYCLACGSSGLFMAHSYAHTMLIVDKSMVNSAIAVLSAICGIAAFLPTYLVTFLMKLMGTSSVTPILCIPMGIGICLAFVCLLETIYLESKQRKD